MRLFLIAAATCVVTFVLLLTIRFWGQGQVYQEFSNNYFNESPLIVVQAESHEQIQNILVQKANAVIWLDVRWNREQDSVTTLNQNITEVLEKYPQQKWVLNIVDNFQGVHEAFFKALEPINKEDFKNKILVQSDFGIVLQSIKKLEPLWLYGSGRGDVLRMKSFQSLWVETAVPLKGDVFITPLKVSGRAVANEGIIFEIHRRNKKTLVGPITNEVELAEALKLKSSGLILKSPDLLQKVQLY